MVATSLTCGGGLCNLYVWLSCVQSTLSLRHLPISVWRGGYGPLVKVGPAHASWLTGWYLRNKLWPLTSLNLVNSLNLSPSSNVVTPWFPRCNYACRIDRLWPVMLAVSELGCILWMLSWLQEGAPLVIQFISWCFMWWSHFGGYYATQCLIWV